ncbi:MAG: tetratricopeptide repeat protein [Leptospira sp.]|nr:tetratricopeptide repeat protein [Leptospira sp.]
MKTKFLICLWLLFNISVFAETAIDELNLGKEKQIQGNCGRAIINFQNALKLNPNSVEAKLGYAQCSKSLGSYNDAKRAYSEILNRYSKNFDAVIGLSEINLELNEITEVPKRIDPLLEEFPNHTGLRILEAKFLLSVQKKELAIYKLQRLSEKLNHPADVEKMLVELYLLSNKWQDADNSLSKYISLVPSDPNGFYLLAKLNLYRNYFQVPNLINSLKDAEINLQNALNLEEKHEASRLLLVQLKIIEAYKQTNIDKALLEQAFKLIYELAREFPENKYYHSLEASLGEELGRDKFSEFHYRRTLHLDDMDEISRLEAEEFAIKSLKEDSKFRRELGDYRKERFLAEKFSLYYKSARFHLLRAKDLTPMNVRGELLNDYDLNGDAVKYINLLIKLREEDPKNFKLQNKLEFAIKSLKTSLESREGLFQIEPKGILTNSVSYTPEVYVFDLESRVPFPEHYPGGRLLARALRYELKNIFHVRLPEDKEFLKIRDQIRETNFHPYTKTIPFSVESLHNLDALRINKDKIRYVLHGNYEFQNDTIDLDISLYDRFTSKDIGHWKTNQKGRDSLSTIVARIAEKVKKILPIEGKILKVKETEVLISLGKQSGLSQKSIVRFERKGKLLMEADMLELGNEISLVKPKNRGWERELATGDFVTVHLTEDKGSKNN